jgi:hypothetical protein
VRDTTASDPLIEDISILIDEALADPSRAGAVKERVRRRLALRLPAVSPSAVEDDLDADAEDLWDNLPL